MNLDNWHELTDEIRKIQQKIENFKKKESHPEKKRLLKLVDAEILDALHNLQNLKNFLGEK